MHIIKVYKILFNQHIFFLQPMLIHRYNYIYLDSFDGVWLSPIPPKLSKTKLGFVVGSEDLSIASDTRFSYQHLLSHYSDNLFPDIMMPNAVSKINLYARIEDTVLETLTITLDDMNNVISATSFK